MEMSITVLYALLLLSAVDCAPNQNSCTYKSEALSYHVTPEKCEKSKSHNAQKLEDEKNQILACVPVELTHEEIKNLESK